MKKLLVISLIAVGLGISACSFFETKSKKIATDELFFVEKFKEDNKSVVKGYMDKTGKIIVGPFEAFEWNGKKYGNDDYKTAYNLFPFIEGMAGICFYDELPSTEDKAKCGFIDKTGKIVIEPKYKSISYFSEGLAAVSEDGRKYGYIDATGKQVIEQKFLSRSAFHDGLAVAREEGIDTKQGYIDKTGKYVIQPKYAFATSFGEGFAIADNADQKRVIIDKTGKEVKDLEGATAGNTDYYYKSSINRQFYQNEGGYAVDEYTLLPSFNEGLTMLSYTYSKDKPIGYAKTDGELEIKLDAKQVAQLRPFADGFAPLGMEIAEKDKLNELLGAGATAELYDWVFVNRKGEIKTPIQDSYRDARPFSEGLAAVQDRASESRWGFINTELKAATPFCFDKVSDFRAGLAYVHLVKFDGNCSQYAEFSKTISSTVIYIDKTGKAVKPQW